MGDRDDDVPTAPMARGVLLDAAAVERRAAGSGNAMPATTMNAPAHVVLVSRDDLAPAIEEIVVRDSGPAAPVMISDAQQPIAREELRLRESSPEVEIRPITSSGFRDDTSRNGAPVAVDDIATAPTPMRERPPIQTSLGVAPLEPATLVRAPFVIDTPVPAFSRLPRAASPRARSPTSHASSPPLGHRLPSDPPRGARPERTAMIALDPSSGMPRAGITRKALASLARRVRSVRWWMARRRRTDVIRRRR